MPKMIAGTMMLPMAGIQSSHTANTITDRIPMENVGTTIDQSVMNCTSATKIDFGNTQASTGSPMPSVRPMASAEAPRISVGAIATRSRLRIGVP